MQSIPLVLALATPLVLATSPPEASPLPEVKSTVPSLRTADPNCPPPGRAEAPNRAEVPNDGNAWNGMPGPGVAPTARVPIAGRPAEMNGNFRMQSGNGTMWGYVGPWNGPPPGPSNQNQPSNQEEGGPARDSRFGGGPAMGGQNGGGMGYAAPWGGQSGFNNQMLPGQPEETNTPPPGYGQWNGPARMGYDMPPPATPFAPIEERLSNIEHRLDDLVQRLSSPPK